MTKVLLKANNKVLATDGKLLTGEKQEGTMLKTVLDETKSTSYLFSGYQGDNLKSLINYNDTENVTNMSYTFNGCPNITQLPTINISNATNLEAWCNSCVKLIDVPPLDTKSVNNYNYTFQNCYELLKIDISYFNSNNAANYTWLNNRKLKAVIIRSFGTNYAINNTVFYGCFRMLHTNNDPYNLYNEHDGYVYVPRDMIETLQSATNWSALYFRALEDYTDDGTTTGKFLDEKAGL